MAPGKMRLGQSLADQLADLEDPTPKDFDPEDLDRDGDSSDEGAGKQSDLNAGREHYQSVGKAKLRKQESIALGKQYAGSRVSRDALNADSDDDPFAAPIDDDQNSNEDMESSPEDEDSVDSGVGGPEPGIDESGDDEKSDGGWRGYRTSHSGSSSRTSPRPRQKSQSKNQEMRLSTQRQPPGMKLSKELSEIIDMTSSSDGSESGRPSRSGSSSGSQGTGSEIEEAIGSSELATEDEDEGQGNDDSDDEAEKEVNPSQDNKAKGVQHADLRPKQDDREELRRLMASDQKTIAATISQAAKADAAKGKAVKEQRTTFDALLNTRIKLQKGLSTINEMSTVVVGRGKDLNEGGEAESDEDEAANAEAIKSAESAALALWSTLEKLRTALSDAQSKEGTKKRKRPSSITFSTPTSSLWDRMTDLESESLSHRRSILDKWSSKVRGTPTTLPNARGKLLGSASGGQNITAVLDSYVASELGDRVSSKRARQDASANSNSIAHHAAVVYDDTAFYQSLLRDLVEQRMSSSEAMAGGLDTLQQLPSRLPIHPVTGMRNDKVKRDVDTRASKGRKMRFNVHEKLQNFMAPEERGAWTVRARDEFFASLLGRTASGLLGEGDDGASDAESDDDQEEGGLKLFRS